MNMSNERKITPAPGQFPLGELKTKIENGTFKIPQFQRQFVWSPKDSAKLIDSILKDIPLELLSFGVPEKE